MESDVAILGLRHFVPIIIGWILFCAIVFGIAMWLVIPRSKKRRPLEILTERFAKGEISKEEFEERRRLLDE